MNAHDLMDMIGDAKGVYIAEAQKHRSGNAQPQRKPLHRNRMWLIAAIVALMSLLVGCAVYIFGFRDVVIGEDEWTPVQARGETTEAAQMRNVISLQGYAGTPGYLAVKEWYEFTQSYEMPDDEAEIPMEERLDYLSYGCFFQEEIDKVDEICEKYGLNKLGIAWVEETPELTFEALGIDGLLLPDAEAEIYYYQGYYYWDGTFDIPFDLTLAGEDSPWRYKLDARMRYVMKTSFDGVNGYMGPLDSYEEWHYTTRQGVEVLLALSADEARMIVDQEDAFLTVHLDNIRVGDIELGEQQLTREGLEAAAEVMDFKVDPKDVDVEAAQARYEALGDRLDQERAEREKALKNYGYKDRIIQLAEGGHDPMSAVYALADIDGNGVDELLLGTEDYFYNVCTMDGTQSKSLVWWIDNTKVYVCENGILMFADDGFNGEIYRYAKIVGKGIEYLDWVKYNPKEAENPWKRVCRENEDGTRSSAFSPLDQNLVNQNISEDEFNKVLASYQKIKIETTPIKEYLTAIDHPFIQDSIDDYLTYYLENSETSENIRYALRDLNGDGKAELLLGGGDTPFGEVIMLVDGMIYYVLSDGTLNGLYLCEDNIVEQYYAADGYESHIYYRIEGHEAVAVDYIWYDGYSGAPDNPWYQSTDGTGDTSSEAAISAEVYNAILNAHPRVDIEMKPISDYPLN